MKTVPGSARHNALVQKLCKLLLDEAGDMPADELLAVVAQCVGTMIAYQDQRKYSSADIMALVTRNIEAGNQRAVESLMNTPAGGHA